MTDDAADTEPTDTDSRSDQAGDSLPDGIPDPESSADFEDDPHVLADEELAYPTLEFTDSELTQEGFDLAEACDREEMESVLDAVAGALVSHDLAVEGDDLRATFGIAPDDLRVQFDPDEDQRGTLTLTVSLDAKVMRYEDADARPIGNRGGRGFIPIEMLTGDRDASDFRCYNWIDDPTSDRAEAPSEPDE